MHRLFEKMGWSVLESLGDCFTFIWILYEESKTWAKEPGVWDMDDLEFLEECFKFWRETGLPIHNTSRTNNTIYKSDDEAFVDSLVCIAVMSGDFAMTRLLLRSDANVNTTYKGNGLLHLVFVTVGRKDQLVSNEDVTRLSHDLLKAGCDPNLRNNEGCTPSHFAIGEGRLKEWASALIMAEVEIIRFLAIEGGRYCESTAIKVDKGVPSEVHQRHRYCSNQGA